MVESVSTRVARGAALLDQHVPGWWKKISLEQFAFVDSCNCILGQLFDARYDQGLKALFSSYRLSDHEFPLDVEHGFDAAEQPWESFDSNQWLTEINTLEETWVSLIKGRYENGAVV